jgi:hypothetical protein
MKIFFTCLIFCLFTFGVVADELEKADSAVANILFDYDGSQEFASYMINDDGFVDITFATNTPDKLYGEILTKMQNHPDIDGVLSGKGGPICKLW